MIDSRFSKRIMVDSNSVRVSDRGVANGGNSNC